MCRHKRLKVNSAENDIGVALALGNQRKMQFGAFKFLEVNGNAEKKANTMDRNVNLAKHGFKTLYLYQSKAPQNKIFETTDIDNNYTMMIGDKWWPIAHFVLQ